MQDDLNGVDQYSLALTGIGGPSASGLPLGNQTPLFQLVDSTGTIPSSLPGINFSLSINFLLFTISLFAAIIPIG